jgi:beta-lactamase class A
MAKSPPAAIANWEPTPATTLGHLTVWAVLRGMRHIGEQILIGL